MGTGEKPLSRKQRILLSAVVWLVAGPVLIGLLFINIFIGLGIGALFIWTTYDYIRKGDMAGHVTEGVSKSGYVARGAEEAFGHEDRD
jgi:hypothetical protein